LSVAAVNSALQRARETIERRAPALRDASPVVKDERVAALLARYVEAWERSDVDALVALLRDDATLAMPPLPQWIQGAREIGASLAAMVLMPGSSGAYRLVPTRANGLPAFAAYSRDDVTAEWQPLSIQAVEVRDGQIASIVAFLDTSLFAPFGLPIRLR
jgi:RNA polymerase sigma-70 factor (ECF subfamily)